MKAKQNDEFKKSAEDLFFYSHTFAISLNIPFIDQFPVAKDIELSRWDFFLTIGCIWVAVIYLHNEVILECEKEEILEIIRKSILKKYPKGVGALNDCMEFMNRSISGNDKILMEDALGYWLVINLYGRKEISGEERKIIKVLGETVLRAFKSYWK